MGVAALAESPDGVVPRPKRPQTVSGDPTEPQFGNPDLARRLAAQGVDPSLIEALCGPIAAAGALKELGVAADPAALAAWGQQNGEWGAEGMARGGGSGMQAMLKSQGVDSEVLPPDAVQQAEAGVEAGKPVIINFAGHYLLATDYNTQTGQWYVGNTGANALKGGSAWMTLGEMAAAPGTKHELRAFIVPTSAAGASPQQGTPAEASAGVAPPTTTSGAVMGAMDRQGDIRSFVRERAQAYGIDPSVAEAVVGSEGGFDSWNRQSDYVNNGVREPSYGPLQLYMNGGLGNAFMAETGLDPRDPANGPAATDWALRYASQHGWGDWHGAQRIGLGNYEGIGATTPTGTPLDTRYLDAARSTTTPGGISTATGGYGTPDKTDISDISDPLVPVRASLDRTGRALSDFGQGAVDYLTRGNLTPGQSDAYDAGVRDATQPTSMQQPASWMAGAPPMGDTGGPANGIASTAPQPLWPNPFGTDPNRATPPGGRYDMPYVTQEPDYVGGLNLGAARRIATGASDVTGEVGNAAVDYGSALLKTLQMPAQMVQGFLTSGHYAGGMDEALRKGDGFYRSFKDVGASDQAAALGAFAASTVTDPLMWTGAGALGRAAEATMGARALAATVLLNGGLGGIFGAMQTPDQPVAGGLVGAATFGIMGLAGMAGHAADPVAARGLLDEVARARESLAVRPVAPDPSLLSLFRTRLAQVLPNAALEAVDREAHTAARVATVLRPDLRNQFVRAFTGTAEQGLVDARGAGERVAGRLNAPMPALDALGPRPSARPIPAAEAPLAIAAAPSAGAPAPEVLRDYPDLARGMAGGAPAEGPIPAEHVPSDWWEQALGGNKKATAKANEIEAGLERVLARNPDPSPAELKQFAGPTATRYSQEIKYTKAEKDAATAAGTKLPKTARADIADFIPNPTPLHTMREMLQVGLRDGYGDWYALVRPSLEGRFGPNAATEAEHLFTTFGQGLSPETATKATIATMIAARENNWFRDLAKLADKERPAWIRGLVNDTYKRVSGDGIGLTYPTHFSSVYDLYTNGFRDVEGGAKLSDFGASNSTASRFPWIALQNTAGDKHMARLVGYRAYGDAEAAYGLETQNRYYRYVNTITRHLAHEASAPAQQAQAALWGVQKLLTLPFDSNAMVAFKRLNPQYASDIDRMLSLGWKDAANGLRDGTVTEEQAFNLAKQIGLVDHPWVLPGGIDAAWEGKGLARALEYWNGERLGDVRSLTPPRGGFGFAGHKDVPQEQAGLRYLGTNPLNQRAAEQASTLSLEGEAAGGVLRRIHDLAYPHTVVDTGGDFGVALPTLSPEHAVRTAQALADRTGATVNVVRMPVRGEQPNALVFSLDRANIPRVAQSYTGLENMVPRMREALASLGVDVHFDGRQVRFIAHTNRVEDVGAAGDAVRGVVQSLGIDPSIVRVGGRVAEAYFPRGAGAVDRPLGLPAGGSVAGRGQYADDLRAALEQGIGRPLPRSATAPADAATGALAAHPAIHEGTGLPLNPDGTVTVYHGTTATGAQEIARTGRLRSAAEPDVYVTTDPAGGTYAPGQTGYGDGTVVAVRVNPDRLILDDEFPNGRRDFRIETGRPGGSVPVRIDPSPPPSTSAPLGRDVGSASTSYALVHGATTATGGLGGGLYGYATAPAGSTEQERRQRAEQYGLIGAGLGLAAGVPLGLAAARGGARAATFADPGVQAIADMHARALASPSIWQKLAAPFKDIGTQFEEQFLDDFARGNKVTTEARTALGVKRADQTPRSIDFEALGALWRGRDAAGAQWVRDGLGKVYEHLTTPSEEAALNVVLKLRRDIEVANIRLAKGVSPADLKFSGGVTSIADAQAKLASIQRQLGPQAWGRLQQAESAFRAHMDSILDAKVRSGLIDAPWAAWLKANHPNYSPSILADDAAAASTSTGKKLSVESHGIRRLSETGHAEDDLPPLTAAVVQTLKENARIMQNDAAGALAHALETAPSTSGRVARVPNVKLTTGTNIAGGVPGTTVVTRQPPIHIPGTISWWEGGTRHFLKVPDEFRPLVDGLMHDAQTAQAAGILVGALKGVVTGPQKVARMFITQKNPVFPILNGMADAVVAGAQGVNPLRVGLGYFDGDAIAAITRAGGAATGWHGQGVQGAKELQAALAPSGGILARAPGDAAKIMQGALSLKPVEMYGNRVEWGPRVAAYKQALAAGATPERATLASRRVTLDFGRAGAFVRKLNSWILFLNASVQGIAQIGRVARDNPKAAATFVAGINAASFAAYEWNRQFRRPDGSLYYDDVPEYVRQTNMVVMIPGTEFTDKDGNPMLHYAAVPLRQLGAIAAPGLAAARAWERESPADYGRYMQTLGLRTLSPIQGESPLGVIGSVLPVGAGTAIELATNKDTYRGNDIIPRGQLGLPTAQQVGSHATTTAKRIGGVLGVAPAQVQHVADTLGGTAQQGMALADIAQGDTASGANALYESTLGRVYRDRGGQLRQDVGDAYAGGLDAAKARAYAALQQTPAWTAAKDDAARNSLIRSTYAQVEKDYQQQPGVQTPDWAAPPQPDGPPKYDPRIVPPEMRAKYAADPYQLQRDIAAAQDVVAAYTRDPKNNPKPTREQQQLAARAQYVSPEWARWNLQTRRPAADERQRTVRGAATAAVGGP